MDNFRFTMIELLAVVVLAALDAAAFRYPLIGRPVSEVLLMLGGLPTANIQPIGLLLLCREGRAKGVLRQCLVGFEVVGRATLLAFAAGANYYSDAMVAFLPFAVLNVGLWRSRYVYVAAAAFLSTPLFFIALLGGWLSIKMRSMDFPPAPRAGSEGFHGL